MDCRTHKFFGKSYVYEYGCQRTQRCPISTPFRDGTVLNADGSYSIPKPKVVAWTTQTVPVGSIVKSKVGNYRSMILGGNDSSGEVALVGRWVTYKDLLEQYTMDDGSPCGVSCDAKH